MSTSETVATSPVLALPRIRDFEPAGDGRHAAWRDIPWQDLERVGGTLPYATRAKAAWSANGLYFLVDCEDRRLSCTFAEDYSDLFTEDVVEIFLQPDPAVGLYLEYEISPLGYELSILVPNDGTHFHGWRPWNQRPDQQPRKATAVRGGARAAGAEVGGWSAEVFIPFAHMAGMAPARPEPGAEWRANLYRIDYDHGQTSHWAWSPATGTGFHNFWDFGTFRFDA